MGVDSMNNMNRMYQMESKKLVWWGTLKLLYKGMSLSGTCKGI